MSLVRRYVKPDEWQPTGIVELEPNALVVVRSTNNRSVIAGPGSGKTELLAQRASYLLQCGAPDLVRIQDILARALDTKTVTPVSKSKGTIVGNSCEVWDFKTAAAEAKCLAEFVAREMKTYKLKPRDFCILVRVRAGDYMKVLEPAFATCGLQLRNEAATVSEVALQELLCETVSEILMTLLRQPNAQAATGPIAWRPSASCAASPSTTTMGGPRSPRR